MRTLIAAAAVLAALPFAASAQESGEDRLRTALREAVSAKRAAEDQASQAQAQLAQAQSDLAALKAKFDADEAKLAKFQGKDAEQAKANEAALAAARAQNSSLQSNLARVQGVVQQANDNARTKDEENRRLAQGMRSNLTALEACKSTNKQLIDLSERVLHLYQDRSFLWVLRKSYEPLIGAAKVDLENIVNDYDNKIQRLEYIPPHAGKP